MEYTIQITAKTTEEFTKIQTVLNVLPEIVRNQIMAAEFAPLMHAFKCTFKANYGNTDFSYTLPKETTQIKDFGNYIGIYSGEFFFIILKENGTVTNYLILKD